MTDFHPNFKMYLVSSFHREEEIETVVKETNLVSTFCFKVVACHTHTNTQYGEMKVYFL